MAADVRGAESQVDDVAAARQAPIVDAAERARAEQGEETAPIEEHTATVIDLRTAEPIVEIERLTD